MIGADVAMQGLLLVAALATILCIASVTGLVLKTRIAHGRPHPVIDNLNARIRAWWLIALVTGLALYAGPAGVLLLFGAAALVALREFTGPWPAARRERGLHLLAAGVVLPVQYLLVWLDATLVALLFVPVCALLLLAASRTARLAARLAAGLMLCAWCLSFVPALLWVDIPGYEGRTVFLVAYLLMVTQASDVLQYIWGKLTGRHRIAPAISPSKTVEGTVGGIASATLLGAVLSPITPFTASEAAVIALSIAILGFLGGLLLSAIKRARGLKDWGTLIDGHGGMLDRIDSLCLSAPAFLLLVRAGWAG
jgi:phosphatidate cytidylyltransferase